MIDLQGKVVVISGAASGIGRETARAFAKHGCRLHLVDIDETGLEDLHTELTETGCPAETYRVDCSDAEQVLGLARQVVQREGRVDVLHNNAGVVVGGPIENISLDDWRWQTGVNYWGVIHGVHAFVPHMIERGSGHIVNTASMAGLVGFPYVVPYSTTKFAIVGLSESLGMELAHHGICVTAVCPASVRTNVFHAGRLRLPGRWDERIRSGVNSIAAEPEWIAEKIVDAVRHKRSMVVLAREMAPLWWLKRFSISAYHRTAGFLTRKALQFGPR